MTEDIGLIHTNIYGAEKRVGDIERSNKTIQERTRCHVHRLPSKIYSVEMVCVCVTKSVKDLNIEVAKDGLSYTLSPSTLVTGSVNLSYTEIQALTFGDYVQTHVSRQKINDNEPRRTGRIALYPSRNTQRGWYFVSLDTGEKVHRYSWDVIPMGTDVIERVNELGRRQGQPMVSKNFKYQWGPDEDNMEFDSDSDDNSDIGDDSVANE